MQVFGTLRRFPLLCELVFLCAVFFSFSALFAGAAENPADTPSYLGIAANGVCEVGVCPPSSVQPDNSTITVPYNFTITLANGDMFQIVGSTTSSISGACGFSSNAPYSFEYVGNADNAGAVSKNDTLTLNGYINWPCSLASATGASSFSGSFSPNIVTDSSTQAQATFDSATLNFGPFSPPGDFASPTAYWTASISGGVLSVAGTTTAVFGAGSPVGSYILYNGAPAPPPPPKLVISGKQSLWWFNGEDPPGYLTKIKLTAKPANYGSYTWTEADTGIGQVLFYNGSSYTTTITTTTNTAEVVASIPSKPRSDIQITVSAGNLQSAPFSLTVLTPNSLVPYDKSPGPVNDTDSRTWGYISHIYYATLDQFGDMLPSIEVPINEKWTTDIINDDPETNWVRGDACRLQNGPVKCGDFLPTFWEDRIQGQNKEKPPTPVPTPEAPHKPVVGDTAVQHWSGQWSVGGHSPGEGVSVQANTWQKYQDHARHTNIVSPDSLSPFP